MLFSCELQLLCTHDWQALLVPENRHELPPTPPLPLLLLEQASAATVITAMAPRPQIFFVMDPSSSAEFTRTVPDTTLGRAWVRQWPGGRPRIVRRAGRPSSSPSLDQHGGGADEPDPGVTGGDGPGTRRCALDGGGATAGLQARAALARDARGRRP